MSHGACEVSYGMCSRGTVVGAQRRRLQAVKFTMARQ